MHPTNRRTFLQQATLISLGFTFLGRCANTSSTGASLSAASLELQKDPAGFLDLPKGFKYRILSRPGDKMDDGFRVPARPDGMGTFDGGNDLVILIRNHENSPLPTGMGPFAGRKRLLEKIDPVKVYDYGKGIQPGLGGTTTLVYNEAKGKMESQYLSLAGTYRNCAGGVTPWNTWLTCEEDVTTKEDIVEKNHGYIFEVPASTEIMLADPIPIPDMGRFNHEAVAVDPVSGVVYQTEDQHDSLIYRFLPNEKGNLHAGGKLQVLAVRDRLRLDTRNWEEQNVKIGEKMAVTWVDVDNALEERDDLRYRGYIKGGARFARGEGMWYGDGEVYFACTNGGPTKYGQVFRYVPSPYEGTPQESEQPATLELFAESPGKSVLHMCDNLTVAPWGDVIMCEDNGALNHIRGINQKGEIYTFATNRSSASELTGVVFSPSGKTMFVNIQESGETLAITGPWGELVNT